MSKDERQTEDLETVVLTLDDDEEIQCGILVVLEVESKEYIALSPLDENGEIDFDDIWLYRFIRDTTGGDDHGLEVIEDEDEIEMVYDKFDEWMDLQEFYEFGCKDEDTEE